jgi:hypothetical protein
LQAVAAALGLQVWISEAGMRTMAVLSRLPLTVTIVEAGHVQLVQYLTFYAYHVHLPSGFANFVARRDLLRCLRPLLARSLSPPASSASSTA